MGQDAGINRRQVEEANRQYETRGAEDLIAELSTKEMWTADDVAQAAVLAQAAENDGRLMQAAMTEQMYRERMSQAGAALQAGSIYKKLTAQRRGGGEPGPGERGQPQARPDGRHDSHGRQHARDELAGAAAEGRNQPAIRPDDRRAAADGAGLRADHLQAGAGEHL